MLSIDLTKRMLPETDPGTFRQHRHHDNRPALLVRHDSADMGRACAMTERARDQAAARQAGRPRKTA